jgi:hypothetical protein
VEIHEELIVVQYRIDLDPSAQDTVIYPSKSIAYSGDYFEYTSLRVTMFQEYNFIMCGNSEPQLQMAMSYRRFVQDNVFH